ncbi:MAG: YkvA family protein [Actinoallomurus sp.]
MILTGLLALLVGAILAFAVPGHVGDVSVGTVGVLVMIVGAVILIAGLPRLRRARRVDRRRGGRSGQAVAERVVDGRVVAGPNAGAGTAGSLAAQRERVYRTSKGKIAAMVVAAVYIVSPIDFIPDFLLPFGVIDDATAFGWLIFAVGQEFSRRRGPAV